LAASQDIYGDVGSGFLGYVIAVLALAAARNNSMWFFVWFTLGGVFFVDATVTLVRRLLRREQIYQAHRSHAYQKLANRWADIARHAFSLGVNLFWLLPLAYLCRHIRSELAAIDNCARATYRGGAIERCWTAESSPS